MLCRREEVSENLGGSAGLIAGRSFLGFGELFGVVRRALALSVLAVCVLCLGFAGSAVGSPSSWSLVVGSGAPVVGVPFVVSLSGVAPAAAAPVFVDPLDPDC
jgi:hypothetical protein